MKTLAPSVSRLGIRGLFVVGLCGLLTAAGAMAVLLTSELVGAEAESEVLVQQRRQVEWAARLLTAACEGQASCAKARAAMASAGAVVYTGAFDVVAGQAERDQPPTVVLDVLQGGASSQAWQVEPGVAGHHHVASAFRGEGGRRAVLSVNFPLGPLRATVSARQRTVASLLVVDLLLVLLFGLYLSGRHIVRPIRRLIAAVESSQAGARIPRLGGAQELARLSIAFADMVDRLNAKNVELERSVVALETAQSQLVRSEKLATVGRLAAGLAHEVGNPLASVLGFVEFLQDDRGVEPALQQELLSRMDRELNRIRGTLRDLLDFSRPAAEQTERMRLGDAVSAAVELVRYQAVMREVTVSVEGTAAAIEAAPGRVRQVLVNLLLNAAQAMKGSGEVHITLGDEDGFALLRLTDTGPGVPEHLRDGLFDPFVTTKPAGEGTGLGLAVCQRIAVEMGGALDLDCQITQGASFVLRVPVAHDAESG